MRDSVILTNINQGLLYCIWRKHDRWPFRKTSVYFVKLEHWYLLVNLSFSGNCFKILKGPLPNGMWRRNNYGPLEDPHGVLLVSGEHRINLKGLGPKKVKNSSILKNRAFKLDLCIQIYSVWRIYSLKSDTLKGDIVTCPFTISEATGDNRFFSK